MLFSDSYFTISGPSAASFKERGSRFLAFACPVNSENDIKQHLAALKKEHPSANHHCYAWRLGPDKAAYRANDDGEPSNSAGKPILGQIQAKDLTNILIVVVRYFGGTLLGVGGLISAYRQAALEALDQAVIIERFILFEYQVEFNYETMNVLMRLLKDYQAKIISSSYEETNNLVFQIRKSDSEQLEQKFKGLYTAKLVFLKAI